MLKLANLLKLSFDDIIIKKEFFYEPVVAFRKKGSHRISPAYMEAAALEVRKRQKLRS